jgi:hypothetical protein
MRWSGKVDVLRVSLAETMTVVALLAGEKAIVEAA